MEFHLKGGYIYILLMKIDGVAKDPISCVVGFTTPSGLSNDLFTIPPKLTS